MKKIISLISVILVLSIVFVGCGSKKASFDNTKNISATAREDGSGTKSAFMELIGLKGAKDPKNVIIQTGTAGVLAEVKSNKYSVAYESLGYVTKDVKMLKVGGVEATVENIKNGSYKISRPLSVVYKQATLNSEANKAFMEYLKSSQAQKIIMDKKYISLSDDAKEYKANSSLTGKIDISGSTSLQPLMVLLAADFEKLQPNVKVTVAGGGSGTGYKNAENGTSAFGMISAEFSKSKAPSCESYIVAKDGIAVIVNKSNTTEDITLENLKKIYDEKNTKAMLWSDLGK